MARKPPSGEVTLAQVERFLRTAPMAQVMRADNTADKRLGPMDTDKTPNKTPAKKTPPKGK